MREVLEYLVEREKEFGRHISVAKMLEGRVDKSRADPDDPAVEIRHINTLKSGLLIHLYNIVEAVMTRTLTEVGSVIVCERPIKWKEPVLGEWVRAAVWSGEGRIGNAALANLINVSKTLVSGDAPSQFIVKGEPGSWDDVSIKKVADRLGCSLDLSADVRRAAYEKIYKDESTALGYLKGRRNAIAHGAITFEDGAEGKTLDEIQALADRIIPFLKEVTASYQSYLDEKKFLEDEGSE